MSAAAKLLLAFWLSFGFGQPVLAASTQIHSQVCQAGFAAPTLIVTPNGTTTQSSAVASGTAQAFSNLKVYNNGSVVASLPAAADGSYSTSFPLTVGGNQIHVNASDGCAGHDLDTATETVTRLAVIPPPPTISQPPDGLQTTDPSVLVSGTTEPDVEQVAIFRGGQAVANVVPDLAGNFAVTAGLVVGQNQLYATATRYSLTSPASNLVTVTRSNPPPPPTPPPTPPTPQPISAPSLSTPHQPTTPAFTASPQSPVISSPSDGTTTNQDSLTAKIQATPGSTTKLENNGRQIAQSIIGADDIMEVNVPLELGPNRLVATSTLNSKTTTSTTITVTRQAATPIAPIISSPPDNTVLKQAVFTLSGQAPADSEIVVDINNTKEVTRVKVGADGRFAVKLELPQGENLLAIRTQQNGLTSSPTLLHLTYAPPQALGPTLMQIIISTLENLLVAIIAALLMIWELITGLLRYLDIHPAVQATVIIIGVGFAGLSAGLWGLEGYATLWAALLQLFQKQTSRPKQGQLFSGRVRDSLTGRPLALAVVSSVAGNTAVTNLNGEFSLGGVPGPYTARRPGYRQLPESNATSSIWMEPVRLNATFAARILDLCTGLTGWAGLVLGSATSLYSLIQHPSLLMLAGALLLTSLLAANTLLLATQPPMKWGQLIDSQTGAPIKDATVELHDRNTGQFIDRYQVDQQGNYTMFAQPGQYTMKIHAPGHQFDDQPVTVFRHKSYFGWLLKGR